MKLNYSFLNIKRNNRSSLFSFIILFFIYSLKIFIIQYMTTKIKLQHSTCQRFGTDCKDLITMIKKLHARPSFATKLERIETLHICFSDFKIIHIPRAQNRIADFLAKTSRSFYMKTSFY